MRRVLLNYLIAALLGAAASVAGAYWGSLSPYLDFFGQFAFQAAIGAIALAIAFGAFKRFVLAVLALAVAASGFLATAPQTSLQACAEPAEHRILFLNIWASNPNVEKSVAFLERSGADTIIVAEAGEGTETAFERLRKLYPYAAECDASDWRCEFLVYSRAPFRVEPGSFRAGMIPLIVDYPNGTLNLTGIHLTRPWPFTWSRAQMRETNRIGKAISTPAAVRIVIGDFNAVTWGAIIKRMSALASVRPLPSRGTWPSILPWPLRVPIDQALVGDGIACAAKTVGPRLSSDHRPIWIDFSFAQK